ncbi:MAG TPA: hypothetical protein VFD72_05960 [Sphingobacteriaceae bacterium]|nr:hypothetical protein [Sphingobacteriaceae bacterium]
MNFLAHYYFHRYSHDPELILGCVLPDFLKNADKRVRLQPERFERQFLNNPKLESLYAGWKHHVEADRVFHNLPFFYEHTHALRLRFDPVVADSPIRSSFLSHIALELMLDHLLLSDDALHEDHFYRELMAVDRSTVRRFLEICEMPDPDTLFRFLDQFIEARYLSSYRELSQVAYALIQICRRVWPLGPQHLLQSQISEQLVFYRKILRPEYKALFESIAD